MTMVNLNCNTFVVLTLASAVLLLAAALLAPPTVETAPEIAVAGYSGPSASAEKGLDIAEDDADIMADEGPRALAAAIDGPAPALWPLGPKG